MITAATPRLCVTLPDRFIPGQSLTESEAGTLTRIFHQRLRSFAVEWLKKGMTPEEVQKNLTALSESYEISPKVSELLDPVDLEAQRIAREVVVKRLASQGLDLDEDDLIRHTLQVARLPQVQARAEEIIRLRKQSTLVGGR